MALVTDDLHEYMVRGADCMKLAPRGFQRSVFLCLSEKKHVSLGQILLSFLRQLIWTSTFGIPRKRPRSRASSRIPAAMRRDMGPSFAT